LICSGVINCAGLNSDVVAEMVGMDIRKEKYSLYYCKGQYFRVASKKASLISHLVYPAPKAVHEGLGNLNEEEIDEIVEEAIVDMGDEFEIKVDEEKANEERVEYKWGYRVKLNDLAILPDLI